MESVRQGGKNNGGRNQLYTVIKEGKKGEDKKPERKKEKKSERIYSIPNINKEINQLFIDNLNGNEIKLNDLLEKSIKEILDDNDELQYSIFLWPIHTKNDFFQWTGTIKWFF